MQFIYLDTTMKPLFYFLVNRWNMERFKEHRHISSFLLYILFYSSVLKLSQDTYNMTVDPLRWNDCVNLLISIEPTIA